MLLRGCLIALCCLLVMCLADFCCCLLSGGFVDLLFVVVCWVFYLWFECYVVALGFSLGINGWVVNCCVLGLLGWFDG